MQNGKLNNSQRQALVKIVQNTYQRRIVIQKASLHDELDRITQEVKDNCRKILAVGKEKGRVTGRLGFIGDSITYSKAYMATSLGAGVENNETGHDYNPIRSWLCEGNPGWNSWYRPRKAKARYSHCRYSN